MDNVLSEHQKHYNFAGATWVALHNGGGVGWGDVINGGFGLLLDGSEVLVFIYLNVFLFKHCNTSTDLIRKNRMPIDEPK